MLVDVPVTRARKIVPFPAVAHLPLPFPSLPLPLTSLHPTTLFFDFKIQLHFISYKTASYDFSFTETQSLSLQYSVICCFYYNY